MRFASFLIVLSVLLTGSTPASAQQCPEGFGMVQDDGVIECEPCSAGTYSAGYDNQCNPWYDFISDLKK